MNSIGPFTLNRVAQGDALDLAQQLPDESIDVLATSPPYWGQRTSFGTGVEEDPRVTHALSHPFGEVTPMERQRL